MEHSENGGVWWEERQRERERERESGEGKEAKPRLYIE